MSSDCKAQGSQDIVGAIRVSVILPKFPHFRISAMQRHFGQPIAPLSCPNPVQSDFS
jgi:hypothetical protein